MAPLVEPERPQRIQTELKKEHNHQHDCFRTDGWKTDPLNEEDNQSPRSQKTYRGDRQKLEEPSIGLVEDLKGEATVQGEAEQSSAQIPARVGDLIIAPQSREQSEDTKIECDPASAT